jgi:alkylation response protein AidB-like acyl-CoA dehydrogenase
MVMVCSPSTSHCGIPHSQSSAGLLGGKVIGLPPVLNFGSESLKARIVPDILAGKKYICLAISEAHAGSDVLGLQTTAVKTPDGKEWIVNGTKKWITNGT